MLQSPPPISSYPDEPHPDDEHTWKSFCGVKKFFWPGQMLTAGDLAFVHACWVETKTRWHLKIIKNKC